MDVETDLRFAHYEPVWLAHQLGITVHHEAPSPEDWKHWRLYKSGGLGDCAIDPRRWHFWTERTVEEAMAYSHVEVDLHEVMHILCHPPGFDLDSVCENFVLLQTEWAYANEIFRGNPHAIRRVMEYQEGTLVLTDWGDEYEMGSSFRSSLSWITGLQIAIRVGLLTPSGRPSFRWPHWPANTALMYGHWYEIVSNGVNMTPLPTKAHTLESFAKLTRDEMYAEIKRLSPELARGKSRAKKPHLQEIYSGLMAGDNAPSTFEEFGEQVMAEADRIQVTQELTDGAVRRRLKNVLGAEQSAVLDRHVEEGFQELVTHVDYSPLEARMATAGVIAVRDADIPEAKRKLPEVVEQLVEAAVAEWDEVGPTRGELQTVEKSEAPVGRRDELEALLARLPAKDRQLLLDYVNLPTWNRKLRRIRDAKARRIRLPYGVTLAEAVRIVV